jgi:hypothetical protein
VENKEDLTEVTEETIEVVEEIIKARMRNVKITLSSEISKNTNN